MNLNDILSKGWEALHSVGVKRSLSLEGTSFKFDATIQESTRAEKGTENRYDFTESDDRECAVMISKERLKSSGASIVRGSTFSDADGNFYDVLADRTQPHEFFARWVCRIYRDG